MDAYWKLRRILTEFARDDAGPTSVEYAVILAVILIGIFSSIQQFGGTSDGLMGKNEQTLNKTFAQALAS